MDLDIQRRLSGYLLRGEKILWTGRPPRGVMFTRSDAFTIPFFLVWTGIPLFGLFSQGRSGFGVQSLFFAPFFLMGGYMLIVRFFHDAWVRAHTFYAVTDRRILILRDGPRAALRSFDRGNLGILELLEDGSRGTILFGQRPAGGRGFIFLPPTTPQFLGIENAREVFDLIQRTGASATG